MDYKKVNDEKDYSLHIELPLIVNKIMKLVGGPDSDIEILNIYKAKVRDIVDIEIDSAIENYLSLYRTSDD